MSQGSEMKSIFNEIEKSIESCRVQECTVISVTSEVGRGSFANVQMTLVGPRDEFQTLYIEETRLNITAIVGKPE